MVKANFFVKLRPFETKLLSRHAVLDDAFTVGVGTVIFQRQVRQRPVLHCTAHHHHCQSHEPFLLGMGAAALHGLCRNEVQREVQHWEAPFEHPFCKEVRHKQCARVQEGRLTWGVQLNPSKEGGQENGHHKHQQHHVLQEALVGRQRNGIAKASALKHALVGDFYDGP